MMKSMTGFGRAETTTSEYRLSVEIKAVNHRYCDINIKLPRKLNALEGRLRSVIKEYASRGKIDVFVNYEDFSEGRAKVNYHENIAKGYIDAATKAAEALGLPHGKPTSAFTLIRLPEVITLEEETMDESLIYPALEEVFRRAAENFSEARQAEGERLKEDLIGKLDGVERMVVEVEKRSPQMLQEYRQRIMDKVEELLGDTQIDERVLATELIVYADKVCVDEETVRLRSHITNMRDTLNLDEAVGRKLDFVAQEMNREANTILSKANDRELSGTAIDLKTEIEKIREQIQNIE